MPLTELRLRTFDNRQTFQALAIKVQIDPTVIAGGRGAFGTVLFLPYPRDIHVRGTPPNMKKDFFRRDAQ